MGMNFPDAPTSGDVFGPYMWDGEKWITSGTSEGGGGLDQATADLLYVNIAGDVMTGPLSLPGDPIDAVHAATKAYVDALIAGVGGGGGGGPPVMISDTVPTEPVSDGSLWWKEGQLYLKYTDSDSSQWVQAVKIIIPPASGGGGGGIAEAPLDGNEYVRKDAGWLSITDQYLKLTGGAVVGDLSVQGHHTVTGRSMLARFGSLSDPNIVFGTAVGFTCGIYGDATDNIGLVTGARLALKVGTTDIKAMLPITLWGDPALPMEAATKQYVDAAAGGGGGDFLPLAGGALTGALSLPATGTTALTQLNFGAPNTGIFGDADTINLSIAGASYFKAEANFVYAYKPVFSFFTGSLSKMNYAIGSDVTGFYGAGNIGAAINGQMKWLLTGTEMSFSVPVMVNNNPTAALQVATKQYVDTAIAAIPAPAADNSVAIAFSFTGKPAAGACLLVPVTEALTIPAGLVGSTAFSLYTTTTSATFSLKHCKADSTQAVIGDMVFASATFPHCTFSGVGATVAVGEALMLVAPAAQDSLLADLAITILATKS